MTRRPKRAAPNSFSEGLYLKNADYAKAEPLLQRRLTITEKTFGSEHPEVAASLLRLNALYAVEGDKTRG